jgi:hypothetical protein
MAQEAPARTKIPTNPHKPARGGAAQSSAGRADPVPGDQLVAGEPGHRRRHHDLPSSQLPPWALANFSAAVSRCPQLGFRGLTPRARSG